MNLSLHIAKRYLFAKKSHNAINIISIMSVCGIAIATMAMVCTLSVFNGFTEFAARTFSAFDPQLEVRAVQGKVFDSSDERILQIQGIEGIDFVSEVLEENALLRFQGRQEPILLKGVSASFRNQSEVDKLIIDGEYALREGDIDFAIIGAGLATTLGVRASSITPLEIYMPKRNERVNMANPASSFTNAHAYSAGVFALNQTRYDNEMLIVSIDLARELLRYDTEISALDIKLKDGVSISTVQRQIQAILGDDFQVKNRFEQQEDTYRMVNIEKWVTYLILSIILIIAVFNIVGSLSMLILEKKNDIIILQNLGAGNPLITRIFLLEGWLITFVGAIGGLIVGLAVCLLQQHFGLLKLGSNAAAFAIDAYPVAVEVMDIVVIFFTVSIVGFLAVLYPINNLRRQL